MTYAIVLDGIVDEELVYNAFHSLITKRWRILGSRIVTHGDSGYAYRIPEIFDEAGNKPFTYSFKSFPGALSSHMTIPRPLSTSSPSTHLPPDTEFLRPPSPLAHSHFKDYIPSCQALFHLTVCHFEQQATAIALTAPHVFCDASGMAEIFKAISSMMKGRDEEVKDLVMDTMLMENIGEAAQTESGESTVEGVKSLWQRDVRETIVRNTTILANVEEEEGRSVYIPNELLQRWKDEVVETLRQDMGENAPKISSGDVLFAWWTKTVYSSATSHDPSQQLALSLPLNLRSRLSDFPAGKVFLHNSLYMSTKIFPSAEAINKYSIADLAVIIRGLIDQASEQEIRRTLGVQVGIYKGDRNLLGLHYPNGSEKFLLSNWLSLGWGSEWFSPPISGGTGSGKILWVSGRGRTNASRRNNGSAVWNDGKGVWLSFSLRKSWWDNGSLGELGAR